MEKHSVQVDVKPNFIEQHREQGKDSYIFSYTITISNRGTDGVKLLKRNWKVVDGEEQTRHVRGEGVVGEQPHLRPGEWFEYTSGVVLESPVGTMEGYYEMIGDDRTEFNVQIPQFILSAPRTLH